MITWALKPNKMQKHRLIWWRNVGSLTFFVCIGFLMAIKSRYLKSVYHKIVTWNTDRTRRLYFIIFFNLLFPYFPIFSWNCVCCHLLSADNFSVFMYNFIHFDSMKFILNQHLNSRDSAFQNGDRFQVLTDFNGRKDTCKIEKK